MGRYRQSIESVLTLYLHHPATQVSVSLMDVRKIKVSHPVCPPDWDATCFDFLYPQASALVIFGALASTTYLQELDICVSDVAHPDSAKAVNTVKVINLINLIS